MSVPLFGNTAISKTSEGIARIDGESPLFAGRVDVHEGTLQVGLNR